MLKYLCRRATASGDAGLGMMETLVGVVVAGLVGTAVVTTFGSSTTGLQSADLRNRNTKQLTVALERMTEVLKGAVRGESTDVPVIDTMADPRRLIRTGNPLTQVRAASGGVEATFYSDIGHPNGPVLVHWYVDEDEQLIEEITPNSPGTHSYLLYDTEPVQRRALLTDVVMPRVGDRPIFSWFGPLSSTPLNVSDPYLPLSEPRLKEVVAVQISLTVRATGKREVVTTLETFGALPPELAALRQPPQWTSPPSSTLVSNKVFCGTCGGLPPTRPTFEDNGGMSNYVPATGSLAGRA